MKQITLEELLEAGCHFGHQVTRQNPKAREFIFEAREGIHIIDLTKTKEGLEQARDYLHGIAKNGGTLLVVGTKRQGKAIIEEEIKRVFATVEDPSLLYVTNRWIGGTLTNFAEVAKNYQRLKDLTKLLSDTTAKETYTKKELGLFEKERQKLENFYRGILHMKQVPDVMLVMDTHMEDLAVREALNMQLPIVGVVDTNADPTRIDYPIPSNDDAVGAIKFIITTLLDAWIEGKQINNTQKKEEEAKKDEKKAQTTEAKTVQKDK